MGQAEVEGPRLKLVVSQKDVEWWARQKLKDYAAKLVVSKKMLGGGPGRK